jgi:hypothetical protein
MKKNLILTTAKDYDYIEIQAFVESLKKTTYSGEVVFFYQNLSARTLKKLKEAGITLIEIEEKNIINSRIYLLRFELCLKFLINKRDAYENILITDLKDVVFQGDPFQYQNYGELNFFLESKTIGGSEQNSSWFKILGKEEWLTNHTQDLISCAGTTIGRPSGIIRYLEEMTEEFSKLNEKQKSGVALDQAIHNYLIYSNTFEGAKLFQNFNGPILTLSFVKEDEIKFNKNKQIINPSGEVILALHQYDRIKIVFYTFNTKKDFFFLKIIKFKKRIKSEIKRIGRILHMPMTELKQKILLRIHSQNNL